MDDHERPRVGPRHAIREDLPPCTPVPLSLVRPYAELPARTVESPVSAHLGADVTDPGRVPRGQATGDGRDDGAGWRPMRRLTAGAARGLKAVRAVTAGGGAVAVVLLLMIVVLHQTGAWPFARDDSTAQRSVPDARLPLPPSAVGTGGPPPGNDGEDEDDEAGRDEDGGSGAEDEGRPGQSPSPPGAAMPAPGRGGGAAEENCGCRATWQVDSQWEDFNATVRVVNTERQQVRAWRITWTWPSGQRLIKGWNAGFQESGVAVTVRNGDGNARIPAGGEATFGLQATGGGSPAPRLVCHVL